jgi:hypothetical protein
VKVYPAAFGTSRAESGRVIAVNSPSIVKKTRFAHRRQRATSALVAVEAARVRDLPRIPGFLTNRKQWQAVASARRKPVGAASVRVARGRGSLSGPGHLIVRRGDRGDEPVAASRNIDQITIALKSIAKDSAQRSNVYSQIARFDEHTGPYASHELFFGYELTMTFDKRNEDLKGTTAEAHGPFGFKQQPLGGNQVERAK